MNIRPSNYRRWLRHWRGFNKIIHTQPSVFRINSLLFLAFLAIVSVIASPGSPPLTITSGSTTTDDIKECGLFIAGNPIHFSSGNMYPSTGFHRFVRVHRVSISSPLFKIAYAVFLPLLPTVFSLVMT